MPDGGRLELSAANLVLDSHDAAMTPEATPGPHVRLRVRDTGEGIPPAIKERIFDPFFTTEQPGKGAGLGWSTVLGIVKSHGGFIEVTSEVGQGSTFEIYLQARPGETPHPTLGLSAAPAPRGRGEAVLVVDDELCIQQIRQRCAAHWTGKAAQTRPGRRTRLEPERGFVRWPRSRLTLEG